MKILITGSNGYLGSILKKEIKGHSVIENDINIYDKKINFENSFSKIDFSKTKGIDAVIHLAGLSTNYDPPDLIYKKIAMKVNAKDTITFAKKAKENGIKKFIFASSASVYGNFNGELAKENSILKPTTSYALSKMKAENGILKLADENFKVIVFRMVTLFGYSKRMRFDVLINNLASNYIQNKKIILKSNGKLIRPQIHVKDVAQFYQQALDSDTIESQIINIGREDYNVKILNLAKKITSILNCPLIIGKHDLDQRSYKVSFKKQNRIFKKINFKKNLTDAFDEIISHYNQKHNFNKNNYYNLKTLEELKQKKLINSLLR